MRSYIVTGLVVALFGVTGLALAQDQLRRISAPQGSAAPAASLASTNKPQAAERYTVIGYLEKRDRVITIKSSPRGAVYSVATKDGKMLLENLSLEQLKTQAPEIHEFIKGAMAGGSSGRRGTADARLRI